VQVNKLAEPRWKIGRPTIEHMCHHPCCSQGKKAVKLCFATVKTTLRAISKGSPSYNQHRRLVFYGTACLRQISAELKVHGKLLASVPANVALKRISRISRNVCYSQRNTFAESAVHTINTPASAATSPTCAHHASPFQIPSSSDTA
jgi:hypothetical protein